MAIRVLLRGRQRKVSIRHISTKFHHTPCFLWQDLLHCKKENWDNLALLEKKGGAPVEPVFLKLFDPFPEPVFFYQEGAVLYRNPAARRLWPEWDGEEPLPDALTDLLEHTVGSLVLENRLWRSMTQPVEGGVLLILRSDAALTLGPDTQKVVGQLRRELSTLHTALSQLSDPHRDAWTGQELEERLSVLRRQFYRMVRMCGHLDALETTAALAPVELKDFFSTLAYQVEGVCRLNGWEFRYEDKTQNLLWTRGDVRRLRLMTLNLISNAVKTVTDHGALGMTLLRRGRQALLTVWDGGGGMSGEELNRLFSHEPLPPRLDPEAGLGLGLDLARQIAEDHGGALLLLNQPGEGLRVTVSLPLDPSAAKEATLYVPEENFAGDVFGDMLVELSDILPPSAFSYQDSEE